MPESPPLSPSLLPLARRVSFNSLLLRFIEIGRGGWLPSVKSRRKWGSANAARRQRRCGSATRERERYSARLRRPRKHARRCSPALFRFRSWPESLGCLRMHARTRECRLYVLRNGDWAAIRIANSRWQDLRERRTHSRLSRAPIVSAQYYRRVK